MQQTDRWGGRRAPFEICKVVLLGVTDMPRIAFAFVIAMLAVPAAAADSEWTVILVVDGDTVKVDSEPDLPRELAVLSVRVRGVDTPETGHRAKCEAERQAGQTASDFARRRVEAAERVVVRNPQWGKWGGGGHRRTDAGRRTAGRDAYRRWAGTALCRRPAAKLVRLTGCRRSG